MMEYWERLTEKITQEFSYCAIMPTFHYSNIPILTDGYWLLALNDST
jgi:hypothetical protein